MYKLDDGRMISCRNIENENEEKKCESTTWSCLFFLKNTNVHSYLIYSITMTENDIQYHRFFDQHDSSTEYKSLQLDYFLFYLLSKPNERSEDSSFRQRWLSSSRSLYLYPR